LRSNCEWRYIKFWASDSHHRCKYNSGKTVRSKFCKQHEVKTRSSKPLSPYHNKKRRVNWKRGGHMQDGTPPHRTQVVQKSETFDAPSYWFGYSVGLALHLPGFKQYDFFHWYYVKDRVYANRHRTRANLKIATITKMQSIFIYVCSERVTQIFARRLRHMIPNDQNRTWNTHWCAFHVMLCIKIFSSHYL